MSDELKSAYELAMERLRSTDEEQDRKKARKLTEEDKQRIAKLREEAQAKLAEMEILHQKNLAGIGGEPEKLAEIEQHYRTDRGRVTSSLESKIARIRRGLHPTGDD